MLRESQRLGFLGARPVERAAEHAAQIGLIEAFRLDEIKQDKKADEALSKDPEVAVEQQEKGEVSVPEKHE